MWGKTNKVTRTRWVDIFKGILILLVIFGHSAQGIVSNDSLVEFEGYYFLHILKNMIYSFHMPAFFLASGLFYFNLENKITTQYLKGKAVKLIYPYFIWSLLTAFFMQLASGNTNSGQGLKEFFYSPIIPFSQFWYLYVYLFIFFTHVTFVKIFGKKGNTFLLALGLVIYILNPFLPNFWIIDNYSKYLIFYSLGLFLLELVNKKKNKIIKKNILVLSCIIFFIVSYMYSYTLINDHSLLSHYIWGISSILGVLMLISISFNILNLGVGRILKYFGDNSIKFYVIHLIPLATCRIILLNYLGGANVLLVFVTSSIFSISLSCIGIYLINKLKMNKLLFNIFD